MKHNPDLKKLIGACLENPALDFAGMGAAWHCILINDPAFAKIYKGTLADVNALQYQLIRNQKYLLQLNQKIAQLQNAVLSWQAIVNAIAAQFHV